MCIDCRRPINCFNDKTRYRTMIILHTIDFIFFIIRLSLVSNDISRQISDTRPYLIPILLFDLIGSVPIIICDIIYIIRRHCVIPLIHKDSSCECLWRTGTMTCFRLNCDKNRPQAILLMRIILIVCSLILKFISFIVGASCSTRFKPECTAYTVIAAFGLVSSTLVIIVELVHFFRLWNYNPTEKRNSDKDNKVYTTDNKDATITKSHRRHLGFLHHSLLNDQNADKFRHSKCTKGSNCESESLHHYLFYHSLVSERHMKFKKLNEEVEIVEKPLIAFYQTTKDEALSIAEKGFPYGNDNDHTLYKDYLHLKKSIYFSLSCRPNVPPLEATICVRLNLGRVKRVTVDGDMVLERYFGLGDGLCDTIYVENADRLYVRMPGQVEKWIISINTGVEVNDKLDGSFYEYCL